MLRTRIMLIAVGIVAVIVGLFAYSIWQRDQAARDEQEQLRLTMIQQAWDLVSGAAIDRAETRALEGLIDPTLIAALEESDRALMQAILGRRITEAIDATDLVRLDIYSSNDELLYSSDPAYFAADLLGTAPRTPLDGEEQISGIRVSGGRVLGLSVVPLFDAGEQLGTAVVTADLSASLAELDSLLGADIVVLDRAGAPTIMWN